MRRSARVSSAKATQKLLQDDAEVEKEEPEAEAGPSAKTTTALKEPAPMPLLQAETEPEKRKRKVSGTKSTMPAVSGFEYPEPLSTTSTEPELTIKGKGKQKRARTPSLSPLVDIQMVGNAGMDGMSASIQTDANASTSVRNALSQPNVDEMDDRNPRHSLFDDESEDEGSQEEEEEEEEEEEPKIKKKKKAKKALKKKVASWKELARPSNVSFAQFPLEIMDAIVSVDSDLDLRDHLALSATCRFFRSAYTDLVWQILFDGAFPQYAGFSVDDIRVNFTASICRDMYGSTNKSDPTLLQSYIFGPKRGDPYRWNAKVGPFERGWRAARYIFTSGLTGAGAPGASRWGQSKAEWLVGEPERLALQEATRTAVLAKNDQTARNTYDGRMELMQGVFETPIYRDLTSHERMCFPGWHRQEADRLAREATEAESALYDAWPSAWRALTVKLVNQPLVTKTDAKKFFKLSDRDLLSVPLVLPVRDGPERYSSYGMPAKGGYRLSTLTALALRAHGGVEGHAAHLNKLAGRAAKAKATRIANGTNRVARPRFRSGLHLGNLTATQLEQLLDAYADELQFGHDFDGYDSFDDGYYDDASYDPYGSALW